MNNSIESEILNLRKEIDKHEFLYRKKNMPLISDLEFDKLVNRLRKLEKMYPQYDSPNSYTHKVGDDSSEGFKKIKHLSPMLSLDNTFSEEEIKAFDSRLSKILDKENNLEYCVEPKIDGAGISAVYEFGKLSRLLTRGNGEEGDDITKNASVIKNLPTTLIGQNIPTLIELRGEAYMTKEEFQNILNLQKKDHAEKQIKISQKDFFQNKQLPEEKKSTYANPRNLAAGTLKLLDKKILQQRNLCAVFYSIGIIEGFKITKHSDLAENLKSWGLPHVNWIAKTIGIHNVIEKIYQLDLDRKSFPYNTDGAVVKLDDMSLYNRAGWTAKSPRWAIAWKYKAERAITKLIDISLQVGRTGAITPVGELQEIILSDTKVSRATLHNADEISRKDIRIGDYVVVEKAGEIIPAVIEVVKNKRDKNSVPYLFPQNCPVCGTKLIKEDNEVVLKCPNFFCSEQMKRRIIHFASRNCMDISGVGESIVSKLFEIGLIKNFTDLYILNFKSLRESAKFGEKVSRNIIDAIESSKKREFWRFIFGLGISDVGEQLAKDLASYFKSLDALQSADLETLKSVEGVGEKVSSSIYNFFRDQRILPIIQIAKNLNLNLNVAEKFFDEKFLNKTFVFSGSLQSMDRNNAKALVESLGAKVSNDVSKNTTYLVTGDSPKSKLEKANKLNVTVLTESEFLEIIKPYQTSTQNITNPPQLELF